MNVSDGGHTGDNVGIYPLLERRCQVIIACDAEADPTIAFGSFTEALRHAYVDLGVDVDIDLSMIMPDPTTGLSKAHCAIGRIRYPECPERPNWLIYMKNSIDRQRAGAGPQLQAHVAGLPARDRPPISSSTMRSSSRTGPSAITSPKRRSAAGSSNPKFVRHWVCRSRCLPRMPTTWTRAPWNFRWHKDRQAWDAWDDLLIHHSPFKAADSDQFRELTKTAERARAGRHRRPRTPCLLPRVHDCPRTASRRRRATPAHRPHQFDRDADPADGGRLLLVAPRPVCERARQPRVDEPVPPWATFGDVPAALPAAADHLLERLRDVLLSLHPQLGADRHRAAASRVGRDACDRVRSTQSGLGMPPAWRPRLLPGSGSPRGARTRRPDEVRAARTAATTRPARDRRWRARPRPPAAPPTPPPTKGDPSQMAGPFGPADLTPAAARR